MKKGNLKEDLIRYLANHPFWHTKAEILRREWKYPDGREYMKPTADRKLREAEEESRIAVKPDPNSTSVIYKFLPVEKRKSYIPFSQRNDVNILFKI